MLDKRPGMLVATNARGRKALLTENRRKEDEVRRRGMT